ncbi:superoxide dismutase 1, soluble [Zychaea mexicana]|uniref:superoxide dismutase 1, soluble n=1 Tax=Zychaea mexicana TaxID=64656 RepID=UPI0022FE1488|nr:superoxide dismutase 1, soluble [Zychaea mexicana]KAI9498572.1 superoxide dismutase 1, soluble [Zychaea mexicana]
MVNAVAYIRNGAYAVVGLIWFAQKDGSNETEVYGNISNVSSGEHGLHIHQYGDLSRGCESFGPHFNPYNHTHGGPTDKVKHVGDFGNVVADANDTVHVRLTVDSLEFSGKNSILGRGIVLHEGKDDLGKGDTPDSKLTGNSGARLACGVIGWAAEEL